MGVQSSICWCTNIYAIHNSTTTTEIVFSEGVNGTARFFDWTINGVMQLQLQMVPHLSAQIYAVSGGGAAWKWN